MAPIPTIPSVRPVGSRPGTKAALRHTPERALFSANDVFLKVANVRNMAISAVASATAFTVFVNHMFSRAIHSVSNSLKPALAEVMIRQSGTRAFRRSSSNGSYGGVPMRIMKA